MVCLGVDCGAWAWMLFAVAALLRVIMAVEVGSVTLKDKFVLRLLLLLPLRDVLAVVVWFASFGSDTIAWRGDHFHLKDGKLYRATS